MTNKQKWYQIDLSRKQKCSEIELHLFVLIQALFVLIQARVTRSLFF